MLSPCQSDVGLTCTGGVVPAMKQSCLVGAVILVVAGEGMFSRLSANQCAPPHELTTCIDGMVGRPQDGNEAAAQLQSG
jgi:hypothetical protein